jgi:hypothetical protein
MEFDLVVDHVLDIVDRREVIGRIDDVRVHVVLGPADGTPRRGDRLAVYAERHCVLSMDEHHRPT